MNTFSTHCLLSRPVTDFKELDHLFKDDEPKYLYVLLNLQREVKGLVADIMFSKEINAGILTFLDNSSTILKLMNLQSINSLLLSIYQANKKGDNRIKIEEYYSQLFYQIYHVLEAINQQIQEKRKLHEAADLQPAIQQAQESSL